MGEIALMPLDADLHGAALQGVYRATPGYWALYGLPGAPPDQAERDLAAVAAEAPGRALMGILQAADPAQESTASALMVGMIDFRLHWPASGVAYIGMLMVAEPYQRQGIARRTWLLLRAWLTAEAHITKVRLGVEQFNHVALKFWERAGFALTGQSDRMRVGDKFVRLLYLEIDLAPDRS